MPKYQSPLSGLKVDNLSRLVASLPSDQSDSFSPASAKSASVPGGSGALLAGDPLTLSGDAWEAAAHHVLALRDAKPVNADTWYQIGEFLDAQHLDSLGLRRLPGRSS